LSTWVYRIAINEAGQHFRRRGRYERMLREDAPQPAEADAGGAAVVDTRLDVHAALARLPDEERTLLVLKYFEGLDYAEMAALLDKPAGTIASGLNRARRRLQELLEDQPADLREDAPAGRHPTQGKSR
jgi:RNA polymerase sigma-70 factor (ECF subfamily)